MRYVVQLYLLLLTLTVACIPPSPGDTNRFLTEHPEYKTPITTPAMQHAVGLKITGRDPRRYLIGGSKEMLAYVDSLPRCPYETMRELEVQGASQGEAVENLQVALQEAAADAVIHFTGKDSSWVFFRPSTMEQPQIKKRLSCYVCGGTSIRFTDRNCQR
jgi:hypothetical protein